MTNIETYTAFVSKKSEKIDLAKMFLRFMTSDEAIEIVANNGLRTALKYEYSQDQFNAFDPIIQDVVTMGKSPYTAYLLNKKHTVLYKNGLGSSWSNYSGDIFRGFVNNTLTAQGAFDEAKTYYKGFIETVYGV